MPFSSPPTQALKQCKMTLDLLKFSSLATSLCLSPEITVLLFFCLYPSLAFYDDKWFSQKSCLALCLCVCFIPWMLVTLPLPGGLLENISSVLKEGQHDFEKGSCESLLSNSLGT